MSTLTIPNTVEQNYRLFAARVGTKTITRVFYVNTNQKQRFSPSLTWGLENKRKQMNSFVETNSWKRSKNASFFFFGVTDESNVR